MRPTDRRCFRENPPPLAGCRVLECCRRLTLGVVMVACWSLLATGTQAATSVEPDARWSAYHAREPKSILELQPFRETQTLALSGLSVTLINLNPRINAWYLLRLNDGMQQHDYHLENPDPDSSVLVLNTAFPLGVLLLGPAMRRTECPLWASAPGRALDQWPLNIARLKAVAYAPLCDGKLLLRSTVRGHKVAQEWVSEFLRDRVPGGDRVVSAVKRTLLKDAHLEPVQTAVSRVPERRTASGPLPALVASAQDDRVLSRGALGIEVVAPNANELGVGRWYEVAGVAGAYVSTLTPGLVKTEILQGDLDRASSLDGIEAIARAYLIAFDLDLFELRFALGTDHPRLDWSPRTPSTVFDPRLPGPDGIGKLTPLARTGLVSPAFMNPVAATFTGGFKRQHGAFKYGALAERNYASHYGMIVEGVIASKLQPGLATLLVTKDGEVRMSTWSGEQDSALADIRYARQNGVPLVVWDEQRGRARPGALVNRWGQGNWSGSEDKLLRALRAGICIQEVAGPRFLIYGYFSSATPSAMARVFQAYHCRYAMLLDMNALEHTYLAIYRSDQARFSVQHLLRGMSVLDKEVAGQPLPRFIGYADNRDFFYLLRKGDGER